MSKLFYVYGDYTDDGILFYIGKGDYSRLRKIKRNKKHTAISSKYGLNRKVLLETYSEEDSFTKEIELIALNKLNLNKYPENHYACNFTDGGEGTSGRIWKVSEETKRKMSKSRTGDKNPMFGTRGRYTFAGRKHTAETKEKMRGRKMSDESKKKISIAKKGTIVSEETKKKLSLAFIGKNSGENNINNKYSNKIRNRIIELKDSKYKNKYIPNVILEEFGIELSADYCSNLYSKYKRKKNNVISSKVST